MRTVRAWYSGAETARDTYARDQVMLAAAAAEPDVGWWRLWHRPQPGLAAGRFHRLPADARVARRLSGGRIVPVGPGVLCATLAISRSAMLDRRGGELRPDQVLNRALRPVLALVRELGADAFYPGRDLVTVGGRAILYASFTVASDGVLLIEQLVSLRTPFSSLAALLSEADPLGVAAVDRDTFSSSIALADLMEPPPEESWPDHLVRHAGGAWGAHVEVSAELERILSAATPPSDEAYRSFARERGPRPIGHASAIAIAMLGVLEVSASLVDGVMSETQISGDVIAPFETLETVASACDGLPPGDGEIPSRIQNALAADGGFALGMGDLAALIQRLT